VKLVKNKFFHVLMAACSLSACEQEEYLPLSPKLEVGYASAISSVSFTAHWQDFPQADHYLLDIAYDADFEKKLNETYPLKVYTTLQAVEGLEPETSYFFRVAAYTKAGTYIDYSPAASVVTERLPQPLAYPPLNTNTKQIQAAWSNVPQAEGYQLQVAEDIDFKSIVRTYTKTAYKDTIQIVDSLRSKHVYFYRVRSILGRHTSEYSNLIYASTVDLGKPVLNKPSEIAYTSAALEWEAVHHASSYHLEVSTDPLFLNREQEIFNQELLEKQKRLSALQANTVYYCRLRAKQDTLYSTYSDVIQFQTLSLNKPKNVTISNVEVNQLSVAWDQVAEAETYEISLAEDEEFITVHPDYHQRVVTGLSFSFTNLRPATTYYLKLRAYGLSSYSSYSETVQVSTIPLAPPTQVTVSARKLNQFTLNWAEVPGAESYLLDIATDDSFEQFLPNYHHREVVGNEIVVNHLSERASYFVRLRSKYEDHSSIISEVVNISAALPSTCLLTESNWSDHWTERYHYNQEVLTEIIGDSAALNATRYRWILNWNGDQLLKADYYKADSSGNLLLNEIWEFDYAAGRWTALHRKDTLLHTLELIYLSYNEHGQLDKISSYADALADSLIYQERYIYEGQKIIEARNSANELVRSWRYTAYFNPESLFKEEVHTLLRAPSGGRIIGFVPQEAVSLYEQSVAEKDRQPLVYQTNSFGMPTEVYSGSITKTFVFESCEF